MLLITLMFWGFAKPCLSWVKDIFPWVMLCQWGGWQEKLGGSRAGRGDPNWAVDVPHHVMGSTSWGSYLEGRPAWLWDGAWHCSVAGEQLHCASLVFSFHDQCYYHLPLLLFFALLSIMPLISTYKFYFDPSSQSTEVRGREGGWVSGCVLLNFQLGLDHDNIKSVHGKKVYDYFNLLFSWAFSLVLVDTSYRFPC